MYALMNAVLRAFPIGSTWTCGYDRPAHSCRYKVIGYKPSTVTPRVTVVFRCLSSVKPSDVGADGVWSFHPLSIQVEQNGWKKIRSK